MILTGKKCRTAAFAVLCCAGMSCEQLDMNVAGLEGQDNLQQLGRVDVSVSVPVPDTKLTSVGDESGINDLQLFVFREDGVIEAYQTAESSRITLDCTAGEKEFIAVVNAPDLSHVQSRSQLMSESSALADNSPGDLVMCGSATGNVPSNAGGDAETDVSITVSRLVARVSVRKITNAITAPAYSSLPLSVKAIYLSNVAGDCRYMSSVTPGTWLNKMGARTDLPSLLSSGTLSGSIANGSSYSTAHYFYCYPNPVASDSSAETWSPRQTRLVVETQLGGKTYYYPVTLPGIEANHTYDIEELKITRLGSSSPDVPVDISDVAVSITVKPWDKGSSTTVSI